MKLSKILPTVTGSSHFEKIFTFKIFLKLVSKRFFKSFEGKHVRYSFLMAILVRYLLSVSVFWISVNWSWLMFKLILWYILPSFVSISVLEVGVDVLSSFDKT